MNRQDILLASAAGILLALSFPSFGLKELGWVCLVPLLAAVRTQQPRHGFILGWVAGSLFHCGLVYWVMVSMTVYGNLPAVLALVVLMLFSAVLGLFIAVPIGLDCFVRRRRLWSITLTLPFFWTAAEHTKSWFLTGFPWQNLGYSQFQVLPLIQIADLTGVYGISFLLVFVNCTLWCLLEALFTKKRPPSASLAVAVMLLSVTIGYGYKRQEGAAQSAGDPLKISIIQPNIPQDLKWDPQFLPETLSVFRRLTLQAEPGSTDLVVWPESATPFFFQSEEAYKKMVADIIGQAQTHLLFGSPSWEPQGAQVRYFNSAFLVSPDNRVLGRYDKIHLVPYGEYVPLKELFPFIHKLAAGIGDFSPGGDIANLRLPSGSFATLICYEIIFPDLVRRFIKKDARFIVNITNDAWFGRTSAPEQHLSMAVLRAVENKRWVVRAANTGISAVIKPSGALTARSKLFTEAVLTATIYGEAEKTFYTVYGDVFALACGAIALLCLLGARAGSGRKQKEIVP